MSRGTSFKEKDVMGNRIRTGGRRRAVLYSHGSRAKNSLYLGLGRPRRSCGALGDVEGKGGGMNK